jgi:membrane associated rhomboid family serine protease
MAHWRISSIQPAMQPPPPVTRALLIAIFAVFFLQQIVPPGIINYLALYPLQSGGFWPWQLLTYPFLHIDFAAAFFNLLALWMFGAELENLWGARRYLQFLGASTIAAAIVYLLLSFVIPAPIVFTNAAGPIYGLLLAFGLLFPRRQILFFFVYPTNMRTAVILFGALELLFIVFQRGTGAVINIAHLGGMLGGYLVILWWRRRPPRFRRVK